MNKETHVEHSWYGCETGRCGYRAERADGSSDFYFDHPNTLSELARICRKKDEPVVFGDVHCGEYGETPTNDLDPSGHDRVESTPETTEEQ